MVYLKIYFVILLIFFFFLIRFFKRLFSKKKQHRIKVSKKKKRSTKKIRFLSAKAKRKADLKYSKILAKFKREHKRKPTKNDLFRIVITASHHTLPVRGKNSRRWMRGKGGHWKRQKVRRYLLEKHKIVEKYKMK